MSKKINMGKSLQAQKELESTSINLNELKNIVGKREVSDVSAEVSGVVKSEKIQTSPEINPEKIETKTLAQEKSVHPKKLMIKDEVDYMYVDYINDVLAIETPVGNFRKNLKKETFNITASPYFIAFFRHYANILNKGISRNRKVGVSAITFGLFVSLLVDSGKLDELAGDDEILKHLAEQLKKDL